MDFNELDMLEVIEDSFGTYADLSCDWEDSGYSEYLEQNNSFGEM